MFTKYRSIKSLLKPEVEYLDRKLNNIFFD